MYAHYASSGLCSSGEVRSELWHLPEKQKIPVVTPQSEDL